MRLPGAVADAILRLGELHRARWPGAVGVGVALLLTVPTWATEPAPGGGTFQPTRSLTQARTAHTATLLRDGRVLVIGGGSALGLGFADDPIASAELWDPATGTFARTGSLAESRAYHTATLLPDGRVLVVGGYGGAEDGVLATAEAWDPVMGAFSPAGSFSAARVWHTATLLPGGTRDLAPPGAGALPRCMTRPRRRTQSTPNRNRPTTHPAPT